MNKVFYLWWEILNFVGIPFNSQLSSSLNSEFHIWVGGVFWFIHREGLLNPHLSPILLAMLVLYMCVPMRLNPFWIQILPSTLKVRLKQNEFTKSLILQNRDWKIWRISALASKRRSNQKSIDVYVLLTCPVWFRFGSGNRSLIDLFWWFLAEW